MSILENIIKLTRSEAPEVTNPFPCVWQVQVCDFAPDGFAFLTEPQSFADALRVIADIGGEDSPKGPRLFLDRKNSVRS